MSSSQRHSRCVRLAVLLCAAATALSAAAARADGLVYFTDIFYPTYSDGFIRTVDTGGAQVQTVRTPGGGLRGIALDPDAGKLYWSDVDLDRIYRANLDGSYAELLPITGLAWPMALAVSPANDLLFFGDQTQGRIGAAHLDGTGAHTLITTPFSSGLAVDELHHKLYWTASVTSETGQILRANLDGSSVEVVVTDHGRPARIALDPMGRKVYWTDYVLDLVARANFDGTGVENLYVVGANLNPDGIALDLDAGKVYWGQSTDYNRAKIMRMNLNGANPEDLVSGFGLLADLAFLATSSGVEPIALAPAPAILRGAWPNPFTDETAIQLALPQVGDVRLTVHAADGRQIATLLAGSLPAGGYTVRWDGRDACGQRVPGGLYYCRIETQGLRQAQRLLLMR
jgi:DNA-binding beta-propeller fold protein YncE